MNVRNLTLAVLSTALIGGTVLPAAAHEGFVSRIFTRPDGEGRWLNRRLTIRHHDQDTPWRAEARRHEDNFLSRMFTRPDDSGRWLDRRLTIRHHDQDCD